MKLRIANVLFVFILISVVLSGCGSYYTVLNMNTSAQIQPDLSGGFVFESQISNDDILQYANSRGESYPAKAIADEIATSIGWDFPYLADVRKDGDTELIQLGAQFSNEDEFCALYPDIDEATLAQAEASLGEENVYSCRLEKTSTPFTDVYNFEYTLFPPSLAGNWIIDLPGTPVETNSSRVGGGGVVWSWGKDVKAVPMRLVSAGLTQFEVTVRMNVSDKGDGNLLIIVKAPSNVVARASSMYPNVSDSAQAIGDRVAHGLNISSYEVSSRQLDMKTEISILMTGLTSEQIQSTLNQSGLMKNADLNIRKSLFINEFRFNGQLNPSKGGVGYPVTIMLSVRLPGQDVARTYKFDASAQSVAVSSHTTNWITILILSGIIIVAVIVIIFVLRKRNKKNSSVHQQAVESSIK